MRLGNWLEPQQRLSAMVELRSETLWRRGPHAAVEMVRAIIESQGGIVHEMRVSRLAGRCKSRR